MRFANLLLNKLAMLLLVAILLRSVDCRKKKKNLVDASARSSAADHSNTTKSSQQDRQQVWSLRKLQHTTLGKSLAKKPIPTKSCTFKVMSYNVLAQELLESHPFLYTYHNPNALKWDQRWYSILGEIKFHNADIMCLQEVQVSHLQQYTKDLGALGYKGIYKQRTGIRRDGCAIYYKESLLNLVEYVTIEFNQNNIWVLDRDNVAIVAKFAPKNDDQNEFVVATTHLLYNRKREDVRLAQTQVLLAEIDRIAYKYDPKRSTDHLPVIITGDFNLTPKSPVYQFLTRGRLKYEHLSNRTLSQEQSQYSNVTGKTLIPALLRITDNCQHHDLVEKRNRGVGDLSRDEELKLISLQHSERKLENRSRVMISEDMFSTGTLSHDLRLRSAYVHNHGYDSEATTYQNDWVTVDYIFYSGDSVETQRRSEDRLKLVSRYTLPITSKLEGMKIPNMALGSDHLSLVVIFRLDP
ncbi:protein angel isoform X2 [Photinus pyralis]|uniref:Endonuclease/exonuclease/phosphatase domain-containing protein n=2 Tax=Photinus pyralis TaxID=7054 RepID=A0A1Y1L9K0_PHOPY|nr:protein angel isoform X2 [Photinus pyralis]